jgi:hypothetical protein
MRTRCLYELIIRLFALQEVLWDTTQIPCCWARGHDLTQINAPSPS